MQRNARQPIGQAPKRPTYRTLHGWALGVLIEHVRLPSASYMAIGGTARIRRRGTELAKKLGGTLSPALRQKPVSQR
jgi:hypothetical protein